MFRANCGGREWDRIPIHRTGDSDSCHVDREKNVSHTCSLCANKYIMVFRSHEDEMRGEGAKKSSRAMFRKLMTWSIGCVKNSLCV